MCNYHLSFLKEQNHQTSATDNSISLQILYIPDMSLIHASISEIFLSQITDNSEPIWGQERWARVQNRIRKLDRNACNRHTNVGTMVNPYKMTQRWNHMAKHSLISCITEMALCPFCHTSTLQICITFNPLQINIRVDKFFLSRSWFSSDEMQHTLNMLINTPWKMLCVYVCFVICWQ